MNQSFLIQFKNDTYADLQCELFEVAESNGWTNNGAVKIEFLDQMIELGKEKAQRFNTTAIVKIWENDSDNEFDPDTDNLIDCYEI